MPPDAPVIKTVPLIFSPTFIAILTVLTSYQRMVKPKTITLPLLSHSARKNFIIYSLKGCNYYEKQILAPSW
jgi:hypothetical protein